MSWKIYGERMFRAMQLDDRFEIKVIERRASACREHKNARLVVFVNLDPLSLRENLQDTLCMRLQMPEHVATHARSSHGCEREEGENACIFRGGRIARIYFAKKKSSLPSNREFSYLFVVYYISSRISRTL